MPFTILVTKETRAGETRVGLIPSDVRQLVAHGHLVYVEHNAGDTAGFSDQDYQRAGATIRHLEENSLSGYKKLFSGINLIVRVKRAEREREIFENQAIAAGTIMIGALDPLEKGSSHMAEYETARIMAHSIDQLRLEPDDPMNVLAAMSRIAGALALQDAIKKCGHAVKKAVIIGFGMAGRSAFAEALKQRLNTMVVLTNPVYVQEVTQQGSGAVLLGKSQSLLEQQKIVKTAVSTADIVIAAARNAHRTAPLLLPLSTLNSMKAGTVVVDMSLSEGGNVEGSEHDATHVLGNDIIVTNTSGYPKAVPQEASKLWSTASLHFILQLPA